MSSSSRDLGNFHSCLGEVRFVSMGVQVAITEFLEVTGVGVTAALLIISFVGLSLPRKRLSTVVTDTPSSEKS